MQQCIHVDSGKAGQDCFPGGGPVERASVVVASGEFERWFLTDLIDVYQRHADLNPDEHAAADGVVDAGEEIAVDLLGCKAIPAECEYERCGTEAEAVVPLDEVSRCEQSVHKLVNRALGRAEAVRERGKSQSLGDRRDGVEDGGESVDCSVMARWHSVECNEGH
nr:hypothetical protein [Rhodococcus koreensis]